MVRRTALAAGLLLGAILIQLIVLDNLRLPGAAGPDLVLLTVVALAACAGPVEGMLGGFAAGLALDVAPPASHLVGQYALVFCLVGYAAGVIGADPDKSAWLPLAVVAVGSAVGELLYALTGMLFGDPDVTWTAIGRAVPAAIVYDLLLSPFVLYGVARAYGVATQGLAALRGHRRPVADGLPAGRRGGRGRRVRQRAAGQWHRRSAPAAGPGAARRGHPGRVGQRRAAAPAGPGPAGAPAARRVQRDAGRLGQRHPGAQDPAGRPGSVAAGQPQLGQPVPHRPPGAAGGAAAGQPGLGQPVPGWPGGRRRGCPQRPARGRGGRPGAAAIPRSPAARRGHGGRVGQRGPGHHQPATPPRPPAARLGAAP